MLQLNAIARSNLTCASSRKSIRSTITHLSRPESLSFISRNSSIARQRARFTHIQVHASQSPNPFGGGGGEDSSKISISDLALPAAGLAFVFVVGPLFGGATAIFGLPLIITGLAAVFGWLDALAGLFGITPLTAAAIVGSTSLGILLIPAFLKFGFIALAGYLVTNLIFGGGSEDDSDVTPGGSSSSNTTNSNSYFNGTMNNSTGRESSRRPSSPYDFDARDVTIDVEAETIDD